MGSDFRFGRLSIAKRPKERHLVLALTAQKSNMSKILQNVLPIEILASKVPKLMKTIEQERGFGSHPQKIGVVITLRKYE